MNHLMVDIETLGVNPRAPVLSIGACLFNTNHGIVEKFYTTLDVTKQLDRVYDASAIRFWVNQGEAAREVFNDVQNRKGLSEFKHWLSSIQFGRVWAKPPAFDLVILKGLIGYSHWKHSKERCLRTLIESTGGSIPFEGSMHNALDDAIHQANLALVCFKILKDKGLGNGF